MFPPPAGGTPLNMIPSSEFTTGMTVSSTEISNLASKFNCSLCPILFSSIFFYRCQSQEHSFRNLLHTNLCVHVCYPGDPACDTECSLMWTLYLIGVQTFLLQRCSNCKNFIQATGNILYSFCQSGQCSGNSLEITLQEASWFSTHPTKLISWFFSYLTVTSGKQQSPDSYK